MPKTTSFLVGTLDKRLTEAVDLAQTVEGTSTFTYTRRLYVFEAAYLLAFSAWEGFLEETFLRFVCGYANSSGQQQRVIGVSRTRTMSAAYAAVLAAGGRNQTYLLWHSPSYPINRSRNFFINGAHETVVSSVQGDIADFAAVRHHVAHRNKDTERKFQMAALRLGGSAVKGGRAGRFLRLPTIDPVTGQPVNWLERICGDLRRYGMQIGD